MKNLKLALICFFGGIAAFAFPQNLTTEDVRQALEEDFSKFRWVNVLSINITDDTSIPSVKLTRIPYDRSIGPGGTILKAEIVYAEVVTRSGMRYSFTFDFFDAPRKEKGAQRAGDAKRRIFGLLVGMFPDDTENPE